MDKLPAVDARKRLQAGTAAELDALLHALFAPTLNGGCATHQFLALQRNKNIIHRYFEKWDNYGETQAADELIATNVTLRILRPWQ